MIILDQQKLSDFFEGVSSGFQRRPLEALIVILLVLLFVGFLLAAYLIQRRKSRRLRARQARERYEQLAQKLGLTAQEQRLVERLAAYLKDSNFKHQLLQNPSTFNYCAGRLSESGEFPASDLAELRLKLGFRIQNPERIPAATSELPIGMPVLIVHQGREGVRRAGAAVHAQEPGSLVLSVAAGSDASLPPAGKPVTVYFQTRSGLFSFASEVRSFHEGLLHLSHAEKIRRTQRRRYYRKKVNLRVEVRRTGAGTEEPALASQLLDLGGEGASLRNPQKRFTAGNELELRFRLGGEPFVLSAEVLRVSRDAQVLHLRFVSLRESVRDRIIGSLFQSLGDTGG